MARKTFRHSDGSNETWDCSTGLYVHTGSDGVVAEQRDLTAAEIDSLDPTARSLRDLTEVVNQLILDALMGGM